MTKTSAPLYILRLALTLLVITALVAAALAGVNAITKDRIAAIQAEKTQKALTQVLPGAADVKPLELTGNTGIVQAVYASEAGYAVEVAPKGFDGEITMMVGIAGGKVTAISIISHTETAGLGAVAAGENSAGVAFRGQFAGQSGTLAVDKDGGTIDALTGATITSRAVVEGVNAALAYVQNLG